jgi:cold shock CspA family protein
MSSGEVKMFNKQGGYGVIKDDRGHVVFFRVRSCAVSPRVGDRVTFGIRINPTSGQQEAYQIAPVVKAAT